MTHRFGSLIQGAVFLLVAVGIAMSIDDRHVPEAIITLAVVVLTSAVGFGLAWGEWRRERDTPRRPSSKRYPARLARRGDADG